MVFCIFFHLASCFEGTSPLYIHKYSIPFNGWIIFHCVHIAVCLPIHPLVDLWLFPQFGYSEECSYGYVCLWIPVFTWLNMHLGVKLWGHMFNFLRNCQIVFYSGWTVLHSHQQCTRIPVPPHLLQYLLYRLVFFLIIAILVSVKWYHFVVLITFS